MKIPQLLRQSLIVIVMFVYQPIYAQFSGGSGTLTDPYQISTIIDLQTLSENEIYWSSHFILLSDIDVSDSKNWNVIDNDTLGFNPIGDLEYNGYRQKVSFKGTFNGNFHTVSNVYINYPLYQYIGFFGNTESAVIKNLTLENIQVTGISYVGGLAGYCNNTKIKNCSVNGNILSESGNIGMLAGCLDNSFIDFCRTSGVITCQNYAGGLAGGTNLTSRINHSYSFVDITGDVIGGLVSCQSGDDILIKDCFSAGSLTGEFGIGGFMGVSSSATIENSWSMGKISGNTYLGGFLGINNLSELVGCFYDIDLSHQSAGFGGDDNDQYVNGLLSTDFDQMSLFLNAGWDFVHSWEMARVPEIDPNTRPYLRMLLHDYFVAVDFSIENSAVVTGECFYDLNDQVTLSVTPEAGYQFVEWQLNGTTISTDNPYSFKCSGNMEFKAVMVEDVAFEGGLGTEENPFRISTIEQLAAINTMTGLLQRHYVIVNDIDASNTRTWNNGKGFDPIGFHNKSEDNLHFTGTIDGQGYVINNLYINRPEEDYIGLIAYNDNGYISNLGIANCEILGNSYVGGIAGYNLKYNSASQKSVYRCYSSGKIKGKENYVGGIIGCDNQGKLELCYSTASVEGENYIGGLLGFCYGSSSYTNMVSCYASGKISGVIAGALAGQSSSAKLSRCCFDATTTQKDYPIYIYSITGAEKLTTNDFSSAAFMQGTVGFDMNNDWKLAVSHDGYTRPLFDWEKLHKVNIKKSTFRTGNGTLGTDTVFVLAHAGNIYDILAMPDSISKFSGWEDHNGNQLTAVNPLNLLNITSDTTIWACFTGNTGLFKAQFTLKDNFTNILSDESFYFDGNYYRSDHNGEIIIYGLTNGKYGYSASKTGYVGVSDTMIISDANVTTDVYLALKLNTITFIVTYNGFPVENASIVSSHTTFPNESYTYTTDENGEAKDYNFLYYGFNYKVTADGYQSNKGSFTIMDTDVTVKVELVGMENVNLTISDGINPIQNATVYFNGDVYITDANGSVTVADVLEGSYTYFILADGFLSTQGQIVMESSVINETIMLETKTDPVYNAIFTLTSNGTIVSENVSLVFQQNAFKPDKYGRVMLLNISAGDYIFSTYSFFYGIYYGQFSITGSDIALTLDLSKATSRLFFMDLEVNDGVSPVAGAEITIDGSSYITGESGCASVVGLLAGTYSYTVKAPGFNDYTSNITFPNSSLSDTVTLSASNSQAYSFTLQVSDGKTAIAGAAVNFEGTVYSTDINGFATINGLYSGTFKYIITAAGFDTLNGTCIIRNADISESIALEESTYSITFVVTNGTYLLSNADIVFDGVAYSICANGKVTIPEKLNGTYSFSVSADCFDAYAGSITVNGNNLKEIISLAESLYTLSVKVAEGVNAIENAEVMVDGISYYSNANGEVLISDMTSGNYVLTVKAAGYYDYTESVIIMRRSENRSVQLIPTSVIMYTVTIGVNDGTNAIENARVNFNNSFYYTNASGEIVISNITNGIYEYTITAAGFNENSGSITISDADITENITLNTIPVPVSTYTVSFYVNDGINAIENASVVFNHSTYTTDANGKIIITDVETNTYIFTVAANGFNDYSSTVVVSEADVYKSVSMVIETSNISFVENSSVRCYPNPVREKLIIEIPESLTYSVLVVTDILGNTLCKVFNEGNSYININLAGFSGNIFIIKVMDNDKVVDTHKILKY